MIKWVRLDERMIHGQVATKWSQLLGVNRIIVADDQAASNEIIKKSLLMAAPANCKTAIVSVEKAIALCNDPRAEALSILLLNSAKVFHRSTLATMEELLQSIVKKYARHIQRTCMPMMMKLKH